MPQLTDTEWEALIKKGESGLVAFYESSKDRNKTAKTICAFSNDMADSRKPGVMFIGVKNKCNP